MLAIITFCNMTDRHVVIIKRLAWARILFRVWLVVMTIGH